MYVALSTIFPPTETMIPRAILPDEVYDREDGAAVTIEGKTVGDDLERDGSGSASGSGDETVER